jgi:hypothetical protein
MVTWHVLSLTQPCVTTLGSTLSVITVNAWWRGAYIYTMAFALLHRPLLVFRWLATPPARFSVVSPLPFGPSCRFSCLLEVFRLVSHVGRFLSPFHRGSYARSGLALHSSSMVMVLWLFAGWGVIDSSRMSWRSFCDAWWLGTRPVVRGPEWVLCSLSSPSSSWIFMAGSSTPSVNVLLACLPPHVVLG